MTRASNDLILATTRVASQNWPAYAEPETVGVTAELNANVTAASRRQLAEHGPGYAFHGRHQFIQSAHR